MASNATGFPNVSSGYPSPPGDQVNHTFNKALATRGPLVPVPNTQTLSAALTLTMESPWVQQITPGAARDLTLPATSNVFLFFIVNRGSTASHIITVKDAAASTLGLIGPGEAGIASSDGTTVNLRTILSSAEAAWLSGVTAGTAAASKALVADSNIDIAGLRNVTATGSFIIGSAALTEAEMEMLDTLTGGVVTASKAVVVDANKHIGTFGQVRGTRFIPQPGALTAINTAGAATYTIAQLLTGCIVRDCAGGSRTDVLPTAADLVAGITGVAVGDVIACYLVNGSDAAETITLDAGAGGAYDAVQIAASRVCPQNTSKWIYIRVTNITGASEAYTVAF